MPVSFSPRSSPIAWAQPSAACSVQRVEPNARAFVERRGEGVDAVVVPVVADVGLPAAPLCRQVQAAEALVHVAVHVAAHARAQRSELLRAHHVRVGGSEPAGPVAPGIEHDKAVVEHRSGAPEQPSAFLAAQARRDARAAPVDPVGHHVDDALEGVVAVDHRHRPADDLEAVDRLDWDVEARDVGAGQGLLERGVLRDAVDQELHPAAHRAAGPDEPVLEVVEQIETGDVPQQLLEGGPAVALDVLAGEDGDARRDVADFLLALAGGADLHLQQVLERQLQQVVEGLGLGVGARQGTSTEQRQAQQSRAAWARRDWAHRLSAVSSHRGAVYRRRRRVNQSHTRACQEISDATTLYTAKAHKHLRMWLLRIHPTPAYARNRPAADPETAITHGRTWA